jgi:hypothetical protein
MTIAAERMIPALPLLPAIPAIVLARAACESGVTQGELSRDLGPYFAHRLAPAAWRETLAAAIATLSVQGLITVTRNRVAVTDKGREALTRELGGHPLPRTWAEMRDSRLVARALGLHAQPGTKIKALAKPDGLRAAILQRHFGLRIKGAPSPAKLRQALAVVALERAFGNSLKGSLGSRTGLAPKAGRLLAGQLSKRPRDFGTDSRLVAALAAEQVGAFQTDADALRIALLRDFVAAHLPASTTAPRASTEAQPAVNVKIRQAPPPTTPQASRPAAANRPDLPGFATVVLSAARARAEGWPGNRKAYISHVWNAVRAQHPEWGLTDIEFKAMLAEAHRTGHVVLANADLKDKRSLKELQESAVAYKNTVWHFVRVEN